MSIYDPISIALGIEPIEHLKFDKELAKKQSISTGVSTFPKGIHGTQDRSFMQDSEYKTKQSIITKKYWDKCSNERRIKAREVIQQTTRKKVEAEGVLYDSLTLCAERYNVSLETIRLWMRRGKDFKYL